MNAKPLSTADGDVYAYVCTSCHHVGSSGSRLVRLDGPDPMLVNSSRLGAERCCTCRTCRAPITGTNERTIECADCRRRREFVNLWGDIADVIRHGDKDYDSWRSRVWGSWEDDE